MRSVAPKPAVRLSVAFSDADGRGEACLGQEERWLVGPPYIEERLLGLTYRVSASAFFQVSTSLHTPSTPFTPSPSTSAIGGDERFEPLLHALLLPALVLLALERVLVRRDDRLEDRLLEDGRASGNCAESCTEELSTSCARGAELRACSNGLDESEYT